MRAFPVPFVAVLALAGCTQAPPGSTHALGSVTRCIPTDQIVARHVAGPAGLDFELLGAGVYRNRLASACPGIDRLGSVAVVAVTSGGEGSRLCSGDRVKVFDSVEARATGLAAYPECLLGDFHRVR